ncbi:MAG TPA: methionine synthase [Clostridiaceae bacterium]|nr:methionine synthase [Clostridiaceae bacterium]
MTYFRTIPVTPSKELILARLGYRKGVTGLDDRYFSLLQEGIKRGKMLCRPAGAYTRLSIVERNSESIKLENGVEFNDGGLSRLLENTREVVLMASTVGSDIVEVIYNEVKTGDAAMGLILDSTASQTADVVLNWMMDFLNKILEREGKRLTRHRYSPGFGNLQLSMQKPLFETLKLETLGMELTGKYMLVPEKSVIAIAGVENIFAEG